MTSKSTRGAYRRELILSAATDLMAESGYPAVTMTQIGAAAGIVGSGVYRHFDSKATILSALLTELAQTMLAGTRGIVGGSGHGFEQLEALIRAQTDIVAGNRSVVAVYLRDVGNLPAEDLRALRDLQRLLLEEWISTCRPVSPRASEAQLRTAVQAVLALINSLCGDDNPLPLERAADSIVAMARAALRTGITTTDE